MEQSADADIVISICIRGNRMKRRVVDLQGAFGVLHLGGDPALKRLTQGGMMGLKLHQGIIALLGQVEQLIDKISGLGGFCWPRWMVQLPHRIGNSISVSLSSLANCCARA